MVLVLFNLLKVPIGQVQLVNGHTHQNWVINSVVVIYKYLCVNQAIQLYSITFYLSLTFSDGFTLPPQKVGRDDSLWSNGSDG